MTDKIKYILSLRKNKYESFINLFKNTNIDIYDHINNSFNDTDNFTEKLYRILNNINETPYCQTCKVNKVSEFISFKCGYNMSCSVKCAANNKNRKEKIKNSNISRYGSICPLNNKDVRKKAIDTLQKNYGDNIINPGQLKIAAKTIKKNWFNNIDSDRLNNCMPMFSAEMFSDSTYRYSEFEFKCNVCETLFKTYMYNGHKPICPNCFPAKSKSKMEEELIIFIRQFYNGTIYRSNRSVLKDAEIDIYLPDLNLGFEMNGIYWHSDKFKENNYHVEKLERCESLGINLINIFEDDWMFKKDIVCSRVRSIIKMSSYKIYARKCIIKEINASIKNKFMNDNHIHGDIKSDINYGLYYNNELISIMAFNKLDNKYEWELVRYCPLKNHNITGGPSKLLKHFITNHNPKNIISYADRCWSNGNMYKKIGFKLSHKTSPSYKCIINGKRETQILDHNALKIYDCGNLVYELFIT